VTTTTLHLVPAALFDASDTTAPYLPEAFDRDGFIHCTDGAQNVADVGNRYYRDDPRPFVVLVIDVAKVGERVVYEDDARIYPHIYGPLRREAIVAVAPVPRGVDGTFLPPQLDAP
jgi:uncharacterized protein (DUF952 family)